jgi:hypothetical protein
MADNRFSFRSPNVDKMADNPLVADRVASNPLVAGMAARERPAPTVWHSGNLPPFTASGLDPKILMTLPIGVRHHAAQLGTKGEVFALAEEVAGNPDAVIHCPSLAEYEQRVTDWMSGLHGDGAPVVEPTAEDAEAFAGVFLSASKPPPLTDRLEAVMERGRMVWREQAPEGEQP